MFEKGAHITHAPLSSRPVIPLERGVLTGMIAPRLSSRSCTTL